MRDFSRACVGYSVQTLAPQRNDPVCPQRQPDALKHLTPV
jgi:hypothetical protein